MDRLINENAVLSAIGEWIAHNEHTYTNATEYLRNRVKAIKTAEREPCEDCIFIPKGAIKVAGEDYITYKRDYLKKWWQPELALLGIDLSSIQPTTKENLVVGDCISRDAVQNYVESHIQEINTGYGDLNNHTNRILRMIVDGIRNLPSIQPKPKTGHWEQYGYSWEDKFKCSECGEEQPKILCGERIIGHWSDYCPNCGADMRERSRNDKRRT